VHTTNKGGWPFVQARCGGTTAVQAWNFQNTSRTAYNMLMLYNGTSRGDQGPPVILRINQVGRSAAQHSTLWPADVDAI
jgi:hypothetical protein